jgi:site-specific DNA-methyltransferase (adenine-specific)/modification methylase
MPFDEVTIGNCRLIHGDCREVLPLLPLDAAIVTDPPYGIGYKHSGGGGKNHAGLNGGRPKSCAFHEERHRVIGDDSPFDPAPWLQWPVVLFWGASHFADKLPARKSWLVWDKHLQETGLSFAECEFAWTTAHLNAKVFRHLWQGALKAGAENATSRVHPTQKPERLMAWCIEQIGSPRVVCDPYMGSGSTGVAAVHLGLRFVGVEIDRRYFDIACERIDRALAQPQLFEDAKVGAGDTAAQGDMLLPANVGDERRAL